MNAAEMLLHGKMLVSPENLAELQERVSMAVWLDMQGVIDSIDKREDFGTKMEVCVVAPWKETLCFGEMWGGKKLGMLVETYRSRPDCREWLIDFLVNKFPEMTFLKDDFEEWDGDGFMMVTHCFLNPYMPDELQCMFDCFTVLYNDGTPLKTGLSAPDRLAFIDKDGNPMSDEAITAVCRVMLRILLKTFAYCNCKNVVIEEVKPSRQVRRWAERHKEPVHSHHKVRIEMMRKVIVKDGPKGHSEMSVLQPMHLCRGHFARYGEAYGTGKLFGRIEGQFWIPQHVRGHLEAGVVTKEYEMR
jgi:hypothetical protein